MSNERHEAEHLHGFILDIDGAGIGTVLIDGKRLGNVASVKFEGKAGQLSVATVGVLLTKGAHIVAPADVRVLPLVDSEDLARWILECPGIAVVRIREGLPSDGLALHPADVLAEHLEARLRTEAGLEG